VPDEGEHAVFHSYTFIAPADAVGTLQEVVFYGGSSASATYGSGVELFRGTFTKVKTVLESYQINATYINLDA
jgi:hypothetical protein